MEECQTKQAKSPVTDTPHKQKVENLPLLCVETIFKFTPTSKLARLYSNDVPLPGAFWQLGLETVLKKRLPLSIGDGSSHRMADIPSAVFDASGAFIASIKAPEAFSDSPLCDLIGSASLAFRVVGPQQSPAVRKIHAVDADALLWSLPNIVELTLLHDHKTKSKCLLSTNPKHLLPRLQSFTIGTSECKVLMEFMHQVLIHQVTSLQRLNIPEEEFEGVMQTVKDNPDPVIRKRARQVLSGLRSLSIWPKDVAYVENDTRRAMLRLVRVRCSHLTTLYLFVDELKPYLAAFRALTGLTTLGIMLYKPNLIGLTFTEDETVTTVVDLRLSCCHPRRAEATISSVASFFPAVKTVAFQGVSAALRLASQVCTRRVLPQLARLNCFIKEEEPVSLSCQLLTQFIANPHLPETVDLSQTIFERLVREPGLLTAIYKAMQANSTTSLVMRGPLHHEALTDLQRHIDSNRENAQVTARKDRDLGEQSGVFNVEEISPQTDVTIIGHKTSGILVGKKFTVRVVHQLTKRRHIFD